MKYRLKNFFVKPLILAFSIFALATISITVSALELSVPQMANVTINTATVASRKSAVSIKVNGTLRADQQRLFRVSPVVDGLVTELNVVAQTKVHKGQVLARLRSKTLGQAQTDYLEALSRYKVAKADYKRIKGLSNDGVVAESRLLAVDSQLKMADAALDQRHRELTLAGMTQSQIKQLAKHPDSIAGYVLLSPADGVLLDVAVENGQMLMAGESAFRIVDLSVVWADVQIPVARMEEVALGSEVIIRVTAYPQKRFIGFLKTLSGEVDVNSQTLSGRVIIDNEKGLLRPGMYVQAEIEGVSQAGLMVPATAVFRRGNDNYVFVATGPRSFNPVKVKIGQPTDGWIRIDSGVSGGATIVSEGVAELKSHWQYQGGE